MSKQLIPDRWDVMEKYVSGSRVLDLGCVDHDSMNTENSEWLHGKICKSAGEVLGVDYLPEEVEKLRVKGYQVTQGNVEELDLGEKFEVITAGNIIEHLSNPGRFLDSVYRHLSDTGHFLITTDNCYGLRSLKGMILKDGIRPHDEHAIAFEEEVFRQLLERHNFEILDFYYYNGPYATAFKKTFMDTLCQFRKSWAWQMLAITRKSK